MKRILFALALLAGVASARAQSFNSFVTQDNGQRVGGTVQMCLNAQGVAVPVSGGQCANAGTPQPVSGTVTSNQGAPNGGQPWPTVVYVAGAAASASNPSPVTVTNFPATQPVSNAGTFAVQNTAPVVGGNSAAVKTDGSATTQPVSAVALPLPAGASTSALQSATQSAAGAQPSAATGVQGVTGGNPVSVTVTNPTPAAPSTVTANQGTAGAAPWPVTQASQPLPTGASTAANQTAIQSAPGTSAGTAQAVQGVTGGVPQNIAASSLPLPANAAQETGGNLATLVARTPALNAAGQSPVSDPNNAAYSAASATYATGATVPAGRAIYLNCSASGSVTMSLSGGGSLAYPVTAGANVLPFAVTAVSADTASCTHQNVN